jgi:predicted Zn-dependent peptidase
MTRATLLFPLLLLPPGPAPAAVERPQIAVEELTLANGMRFLLFERHESPTVAAGWMAHVGSANERPGITGLSHFFEHMMFKGTKAIGTKDLGADLRLIEEQEVVQEQIRAELEVMRERLRRGEISDLTRLESQTQRYRELEEQFRALVERHRAIVVKDELDRIYTQNGGEGLNASTNEDFTQYFIRVPANRLELWAWLESDRLLNPVFREFYSERDVVYEERRLRVESTPLGKFDEAFDAVYWEAHPYKWPVIGWPSDIPTYSLAQAKDYFATYYAPNNLTGALVGDFKAAEVKPLLERYFGRIPRGQASPPPVVTLEPPQLGEKRYLAEAETSPTLRVFWHAVPFVHKDMPALDLLSDVLSGRTGRLYKGLVEGRQVANDAAAYIDPKRYAGTFVARVTVKDGKDPAEAERALFAEIARLQQEAVPTEELQKVKNAYKANAYRRLASPFFIMAQLLQYEGLGDWGYINTSAEKAEAVTAFDLRRVAQQYLTRENRTVGVFLRKEGGSPEDPELLAIAEPQRAMVKQNLEQIAAATDPGKLEAGIAQMRQAAGQVPPEMKPALELILKRAEERLAALRQKK